MSTFIIAVLCYSIIVLLIIILSLFIGDTNLSQILDKILYIMFIIFIVICLGYLLVFVADFFMYIN